MTNVNINKSEHIAKFPQHGTPYSGLRKKGDHKRAYTVAALAMAGMVQWDSKEGTIAGFSDGSRSRASTLLGSSAFRHWASTTGRIGESGLTEAGRVEVSNSLKGSGNLNTIPGLISAYIGAFADGILREPGTGAVIERYNADAKLVALETAPKATKAPSKGTSKASTRKASTSAQKASKPSTRRASAKKAQPVMITPESKA